MLVDAGNYEAEVAVASTGIVYVAWVSGGKAYVSRSLDQGATFQTAVQAGNASSSTVHMATDGQYVYLIDRPCGTFLRSTDNAQTFSSVTLDGMQVFSDVHVDPANHNVVVQVDDANVRYYVSTDYGATFGTIIQPSSPKSVSYSVGTLSSGVGGRYLMVAGSSTAAIKINLADGSSTIPTSFPNNDTSNGRSLTSDTFGNVVAGYTSTGSVKYAISPDLGENFGLAVTVDTASQSCAAINPTNGDLMFAYEKSGKIYLAVYGAELGGYSLLVAASNLTFATQTVSTSSSPKALVITNQSGSAVSITGVSTSGDFSQTHNAPGSLAPSASFTANVVFSPTTAGTRTGTLDVAYGAGMHRIVTLYGEGTDTAGIGTPGTQASNVTFPAVTGSQLTVNWTNGSGTSRAVFIAATTSGQSSPSDFVSYTANTAFGSGSTAGSGWYCVYNGTGTAVTVTGLSMGTWYRVHVVEYNGTSGSQAYNSSANGTNPANRSTTASTVTIPVTDAFGTTVMALLLMAVGAYALRNRRIMNAA